MEHWRSTFAKTERFIRNAILHRKKYARGVPSRNVDTSARYDHLEQNVSCMQIILVPFPTLKYSIF